MAMTLGRAQATVNACAMACVGALGFGGCSSDIFDVSVELGQEAFHLDFGTATGTVPAVACDSAAPQPCGSDGVIALASGAGETDVSAGCDPSSARCYVQANARVFYVVDVLRDDAFTSKVGRRAVSLVRMLDVAYRVPANTASFTLPRMDVFVGPAEARTAADAGVVPVDSIPPLAAGETIGPEGAGHLTIADGSAGRAFMETSIKRKAPFAFILTASPRMESGAPLPAGNMDVVLQPLLGLGVR